MTTTETPKPQRFSSERYQSSRRLLNVWASYTVAMQNGGECPTLAKIDERAESVFGVYVHRMTGERLIAFAIPEEGYRVWQYTGFVRVRWKDRASALDNPVRSMALSVEGVLATISKRKGFDVRSMLLARYPQYGPYEVSPGRLDYATGRLFTSIERAALDALAVMAS